MFDEGKKKVKFREKIKAYLEHAENMKQRLRPVTEELPLLQSLGQTEWDDWPQVCFCLKMVKINTFKTFLISVD